MTLHTVSSPGGAGFRADLDEPCSACPWRQVGPTHPDVSLVDAVNDGNLPACHLTLQTRTETDARGRVWHVVPNRQLCPGAIMVRDGCETSARGVPLRQFNRVPA